MKSNMYNISKKINEMIDNRIFKSYTVDAVLQDNSIRLDEKSLDFLYLNNDYQKYIDQKKLSKERTYLYSLSQSIINGINNDYEKVKKIVDFVANISYTFPLRTQNNEKSYKSPSEYFWGGTEELLIFKGSDWCAELARVFCALCQCLNLPARIVYTFSQADGHIINEVLIQGKWLLVDSTNGFIYQYEGTYISLKDLYFNKKIREIVLKSYNKYYYSNNSYFENVFISYYWVSQFEKYNYELSFCNKYYENALSNVWNMEDNKQDEKCDNMGHIEFM